jgi:hypothetical protein
MKKIVVYHKLTNDKSALTVMCKVIKTHKSYKMPWIWNICGLVQINWNLT